MDGVGCLFGRDSGLRPMVVLLLDVIAFLLGVVCGMLLSELLDWTGRR